jgi:hypothetical protein
MSPNQLLARHLEAANAVARESVVHGKDLTQRQRVFLVKAGCLIEVMKGWYLLAPPGAQAGDTTLWHGNFRAFLGFYLEDRFEGGYCLTAETSLDLWAGQTRTPDQVIIMIREGGNNRIELAFGTSIVTYRDDPRMPTQPAKFRGLNVMPPGMALARVSSTYFEKDRASAEILLRITDEQEIARGLLEFGKVASANRVIGALKAIGQDEKAQKVLDVLALARMEVKPENPFPDSSALISRQVVIRSPYAGRIHALWPGMRSTVIGNFPKPPGQRSSKEAYIRDAAEIYTNDAYNSLSIEGYAVTPELIERIRAGAFDQDRPESRQQRDALAARGYFLSHKTVLRSIERILDGENPGRVADRDLQTWYAQLHQPYVDAGIIPAYALAGYRERRVHIRNSMHVPPPREAVPDAMEALFEALTAEEHPGARAVLGHFAFVFIHPYSDGNGRIGRFLMNVMLASGGYPWTIIRVARRTAYMAALEEASTKGNIADFTRFLAGEMQVDWSHEPATRE